MTFLTQFLPLALIGGAIGLLLGPAETPELAQLALDLALALSLAAAILALIGLA